MNLDQHLRKIDASRVALMDELEAMDPARLAAKPAAGKWSILEIVEHLVLAERAVFKGMPDPSRLEAREPTATDRVRYLLVAFLLKSPVPVRVPSRAMVPKGALTLVELRRLWDENQNWLRAYVAGLDAAGLRRTVFEHPVAGPLTAEQAVRLGRIHADRHIRQIRALRLAPFHG